MTDKQQQILQMAKDICRYQPCCNNVCKPISACDALRYAERAVDEGYVKQEWISVEERLPDCIMNCIVHIVHSYAKDCYSSIRLAVFAGGEFGVDKAYRVTHWMPLPEAPKGGK